MSFDQNLKYTKEHEWVRFEDDIAVIGITDYAADQLGDVVFLDLPKVGSTITAGSVFGEIESTKSVSDLYAPVTGEVLEVNRVPEDNPELVNQDPFGAAWLLKVRFTVEGELIDAAAYEAFITEE